MRAFSYLARLLSTDCVRSSLRQLVVTCVVVYVQLRLLCVSAAVICCILVILVSFRFVMKFRDWLACVCGVVNDLVSFR